MSSSVLSSKPYRKTASPRGASASPAPVSAPASEGASLLAQLGRRIKHARMVHGLTLRELADQAGCSESMVSKVERGLAAPSLSVLHRLASVLQTNIAELTVSEDMTMSPVLRAFERPVLNLAGARQRGGIRLERLVMPRRGQLLQGDIHVIPPGGHSKEPITHLGEEFGFVLEGQLELQLNGERHRLAAGDSFYFSSDIPHSYSNPGTATTRVLWVNTPATY